MYGHACNISNIWQHTCYTKTAFTNALVVVIVCSKDSELINGYRFLTAWVTIALLILAPNKQRTKFHCCHELLEYCSCDTRYWWRNIDILVLTLDILIISSRPYLLQVLISRLFHLIPTSIPGSHSIPSASSVHPQPPVPSWRLEGRALGARPGLGGMNRTEMEEHQTWALYWDTRLGLLGLVSETAGLGGLIMVLKNIYGDKKAYFCLSQEIFF